MELREKAVVELEIDDSQSSGRMAELKAELGDINKELRGLKEAGEVGSEAWKELKTQQRGLNSELKDLKHTIDVNDASLGELNESLRYWQKEAKTAKVNSEEWIEAAKKVGEIKSRITEVKEEMDELGGAVKKHSDEGGYWSGMKAQILATFTGMGLLEIVKSATSAVFDFGKEVFETTAKFEKYDAVLGNALGSQEAATKAMNDIKEMAASTPFSVDELTESYLKYVNRGLQPTMAEMTKLGDIAASQGKSFDQLTEAVLDAGTGEFERLKEFGIQASKSGEEVELSFKGVQKTVANTPEAIQGALLAFGELEGVQGGMAVISGTLEGRVSNLGDSYDSLMLILGDALMPIFDGLLTLMSGGIKIISDLLSGNISLTESSTFLGEAFDAVGQIFKTVWGVVVSLVEIGAELFGTLAKIIDNSIGLSGQGNILTGVLNGLNFAIKGVATVAFVALTGLQMLADGMLIVQNKAKELANFFGADFKIDTKATFENLKNNAESNLQRIEQIWTETSKKGAESAIANNKRVVDTHKEGAEKQTETEKKEAEKRKKEAEKLADDKVKAEGTLQKKLEDMQVKAIADDTKRLIAKADLDYKREQEAVQKSVASDATKKRVLAAAEKAHETAIEKITTDARTKAQKAEADKRKKEADELKKKEAEEKKYRENRLKDENKLLDDEFKAAVANAKISLSLTKENSAAEWEAKKKILEIELKYKQDKLRKEAADEKARIEESVQDTTLRAARIKAVDDRLSAELRTNETKLQADKKKLQEDANAARQKNNEQFYGALEKAMSGDMNSFLKFLQDKYANEAGNLQKRLQANMQHIQGVGNAMQAGIETLTKLNESYTKGQIDRLTKEKDANFKKLDDEFAKGKISKEQLEAEKTRLQGEFDEKNLDLKRKEFERNKKMQIASALIAGSMAVLSALATPPFPLGLVLAVTAGIKTAIDINKIRKTQFEARDGYVSNAGILEGGRHGSSYGQGGIAMYDRNSGQEIGEAEGGEAFMILSRETTKNNLPLIRRLMDSSLNRNGAPVMLENGGIVPIGQVDSFVGNFWRNGVLKMWNQGTLEGVDMSQSASPEATAAIAENKKLSEQMEKNTRETAQNTKPLSEQIETLLNISRQIANKPSGISLHDLNNAVERAVAGSRKSNM